MITSAEITKKAGAHWNSRRFLKAELAGEPFFPLRIAFRTPSGAELLRNFKGIGAWIKQLRQNSRERIGYGYTIEWVEVNHRTLGMQQLPGRIVIPSREDFLRLIGREKDYLRFQQDLELIVEGQPLLRGFLHRHPGKVLTNAGAWPRLLAVVGFFRQNPAPNLYIRELEIPGVDSKFIEQHRGIISELLEQVLPESAIKGGVKGLGRHGFERRYGLKYDQPLIRFRLLDHDLQPMAGLDDITVPIDRFAGLRFACTRVVITENKMNGLAFPAMAKSLVVFGLGYGIGQLAEVPWLHHPDLRIYYWGDIDTHGFTILSRLRAIFPSTRSLLMDEQTLKHYQHLWGVEPEPYLEDLDNLSIAEQKVFDALRTRAHGGHIRLEQERIAYSEVLRVTREIEQEAQGV